MKIEQTRDNSTLTLALEGRLDTITAPELEQVVNANLEGLTALIFDFAKLEYVSSAGGAVLSKLVDHLIDMIGGISLDPADLFAGLFKIYAFVRFEPSLGICLAERAERSAKRFIIESRLYFLLQSFICHSAASFPSVGRSLPVTRL